MPWLFEHYKDASAVGINVDELVHEERNRWQTIKVYDSKVHGRVLTLDDMVMLTELDEFAYHELLTHVPLLAHPAPRDVLVVGGGDGGAVREALKHPSVDRVVLCEIDERVTRVCQEHIPSVASGLDDARVELVFENAVSWVKTQPGQFDAILVDSTEPQGTAGAGAELFQRAFFRDLHAALRGTGVLSAQTESPFYAPELVRSVFTEMRATFEHVRPYYGLVPTYPGGGWTYCLASDRPPSPPDPARIQGLETRYYNAELADGVFRLPTFIRDLAEASP